MTREKLHISEEDFRRYLKNEMTENERNTFEKELQKNPFEAEALEGFEAVPSANIKNNLAELKEKIHPVKQKNHYRYFAAAATILLVITAGVIWIQLDNQDPAPKMAEKKEVEILKSEDRIQKTQKNIQEPDQSQETGGRQSPLAVEIDDDDIKAKTVKEAEIIEESSEIEQVAEIKEQTRSGIPETGNAEADREEVNITVPKTVTDEISYVPTTKAASLSAIPKDARKPESNKIYIKGVLNSEKPQKESEKSTIHGKVVSVNDNEPLTGVSLVEKGTDNRIVTDIEGNFELQLLNDSNPTIIASYVGMETAEVQPNYDSDNIILMSPDNVSLDEVVVTGYESHREKQTVGHVVRISKNPKNSDPLPVCGMKEYNNYLKENAILPPDYHRRKEVVKLRLHLDRDGNITLIGNINQAGSIIFKKAKTIVLNGPEWSPEIKNGTNIESQVELKIIFRIK